MPHDHAGKHSHPHPPRAHSHGPGHNHAGRQVAQWQDPSGNAAMPPAAEPDLDLVESAFCEAAREASDPTSLLRLARVPFVADMGGGRLMRLLSYRVENETEVGDIAPGFVIGDVVYHPLPASRVKQHRRLRFLYHTPEGLRDFALAELRDLPDLVAAPAAESAPR